MNGEHSSLRSAVCEANRQIGALGLAPLTWGNASAVDREAGIMAIKPSGIEYARLQPENMSLVDLVTGEPLDPSIRPSSDTDTHLLLYRSFPTIGGIVHTHSRYATVWAQACREIPCLGTTHADHFFGPVPVTRQLTEQEIEENYVLNTGEVIVERFESGQIDPDDVPGVLVACHGPFVWGPTVEKALENALALEIIAHMASESMRLSSGLGPIPDALLKRHHRRKHGPGATYGQKA